MLIVGPIVNEDRSSIAKMKEVPTDVPQFHLEVANTSDLLGACVCVLMFGTLMADFFFVVITFLVYLCSFVPLR